MYGISQEQVMASRKKVALDLKARLERGWEVTNGLPNDHPHVAHWISLLREYEEAVKQYVYAGGNTSSV